MPTTHPAPRRVLVVGATGTVGAAVLAELQAATDPSATGIRVLVRRASGSHDFGSTTEVVQGDLSDPSAVDAALAGVDTAFYVSPHAENETLLAETFVRACERAGVRIVFAGVHQTGQDWRGRVLLRLYGLLAPHYRGKFAIGQLIERSNTRPVLFSPACFYENDTVFAPDILTGSFPTPLRGMKRVSVDDIAVACRRALLEPDFPVGTYPLTGPDTLTGDQCAQVWSAVLGRVVCYTGTDRKRWLAAADRAFPDGGRKKRDWLATYEALGRMRVPVRRRELLATQRVLGRAPLRYRDYVEAAVRDLRASAVG